MAILGIGTDIVETARFREGEISERFLQRVFTEAERAYCAGQRLPERHLAARFAAKEAAVKALSGVLPDLLISQIEVVKLAGGAPRLRLVVELPPGVVLHVTLSHVADYATATVVAERN